MKCPSCDSATPAGRPTCTRCGTSLLTTTDPPHESPDAAEGPAPFPAPHRTGGRERALIAAALAGALALGGGLTYLILPSGHPRPRTVVTDPEGAAPPASSGTADAAAQLAAVNEVLASHAASGNSLDNPMATCTDVAATAPVFQEFVRTRQDELVRAQALQVDQIAGGAELRQAITDAYAYSITADRAYLAWAQELASEDCGGDAPPHTANYQDAVAANDQAGPAKRRVATLWNPLAQSQGLPLYDWQDL
jgi:hypothetical protein